ncbi:MAG: IclR family transcriptional regulator [Actinomycetes bacterium]
MRNKPPYAIESVDHALHLAQLLRHEGSLGVTEAAERLGVARSTAHRLLAMLVYRDFAEQGEDRRYRPGAMLRTTGTPAAPTALLRRAALPRAEVLVATVHESANLQVLVGTEVRFVLTVECDQVLRVGDRAGKVLPAHLASGGKVLLAALPDAEITARYADRDDVDVPRLLQELRLVRKRGFAVNDGATERGVTAVGVAVLGADRVPVAALTLAIPSARFQRAGLAGYVAALNGAARGIERDLGPSPHG